MLDVGRIVRPHGLSGQVVVELWTNIEDRLRPGTQLEAGSRVLEVTLSSRLPEKAGYTRWLVTFAGVASREAAEQLRDVTLRAEPVDVAGALWVHELIGAELFGPDGARIGRIEAVQANPASDLLILDSGPLVPLTFVSRADDGRWTVDGPPGLLDPEP